MQATARRLSVVSATSCARRRLIRDVVQESKMTADSIYYVGWTRCPCCCGGEGLIILLTCPQCRTLFGVCDEVDTLISDIRTLKMNGVTYSPDDRLCPTCGIARLKDFEPPDFQRIVDAGFSENDIFRMPKPFPGRPCPSGRHPITFQEYKEAQQAAP